MQHYGSVNADNHSVIHRVGVEGVSMGEETGKVGRGQFGLILTCYRPCSSSQQSSQPFPHKLRKLCDLFQETHV